MTLDSAINLESLVTKLHSSTIDQAYDWLGFDYGRLSSAAIEPKDALLRERFVSRVAWLTPPSDEYIRRLFNQVNTYYAERRCLDSPAEDPATLLLEINRIALHRQGKHLGLRRRGIEFGIRVHLDVLDAWRRWPWLRGANPEFLDEMVAEWCRAVEQVPRIVDSALVLAMALIAIHPFSDANGRAGRIVFSWLCRRWGLRDVWLNEGTDGELLRTGTGLNSTEYLMAAFMIALMGSHNIVAPGAAGREQRGSGLKMRDAMRASLEEISLHVGVTESTEFHALKQHWTRDHHLRTTSPRFECLRRLIQ